MRLIKTLLLSSVLWSSVVFADWGLTMGTGSFMGERHGGLAYISENKKHHTEFSYGNTPGLLGEDIRQLNLKYIFSPFSYSYKGVSTNWLGVGALVSRCLCNDVFLDSPEEFPEYNYYDQNAYRTGFVLSSRVYWNQIEAYWDWTLLDQVAIAAFNNTRHIKSKEIWTGGFGMRYWF